jgi:UTP--glucose-1-phosphate uridylyltransferase
MIRKCLFPAAGYGTRFLPATKAVPKEMLPIINKPLLQYGVEEALSAQIKNMAIVTGRHKRAIEDHFDHSFELESILDRTSKKEFLKEIKEIIDESTFTYVRQKRMLGLGDAILTGQALIGDEAFAVILADDLCDYLESNLLLKMIEIYSQHKCSVIAVQELPMTQISQYGVISGDFLNDNNNILQVTNMVEKPEEKNAPSNLAVIGRYILTPDIFDILKKTTPDKNGEIQLTDALLVQAKLGKVLALNFNGKRFDCGTINGFLDATNYFAKKQLNINDS